MDADLSESGHRLVRNRRFFELRGPRRPPPESSLAEAEQEPTSRKAFVKQHKDNLYLSGKGSTLGGL